MGKDIVVNLSDQLKLSLPSPWRLFKTSNVKQNFAFEYMPEYMSPSTIQSVVGEFPIFTVHSYFNFIYYIILLAIY